MEIESDVVVVGGGLSGLVSARELKRVGLSVRILEAKDRVGGRTLSQPLAGYVAEAGGQWIGPTQTEMLALARELGIAVFPTFADGLAVLSFGGHRSLSSELGGLSSETRSFITRLEALASDVPLDAPWGAPLAGEWDALSLASWLEREGADAATRMSFEFAVAPTLGASASTISLLWYLFYLRSAGGYDALETIRGGAQDSRLEGGAQLVSLRLAAEFDDDLELNAPVRSITTGDECVTVRTDAMTITGERAIVAMMPSDIRRIEFDPLLPLERAALNDRWPDSANAFKVSAAYTEPFWRREGLTGVSASDRRIWLTFDNSPHDGSIGILVGFANREAFADEDAARRTEVLDDLSHLFGDRARDVIDYAEFDWARESWTAGCVSPVPPGLLTQAGRALRVPVGPVHWAGTETSDVWCGYMEGAVRAGKRAAGEVLAMLRSEG